MKIILAQLKKDLASCKFLFWAWVVCIAANCLFFLDRLPLPSINEPNKLAVFVVTMAGLMTGMIASYFLQLLLLMALVVQVIQADPLTERDAFWRTRPVSRGTLLAEKVLFIVLLLSGELLAAWAIRFNAGTASQVHQGIQFVEFVSGLAAFAAVTANVSNLIGTAVVIACVTQVLTAIFVKVAENAQLIHLGHSSFPGAGYSPFFGHVAPFEISAVYLAGFIFVFVWQYLTLKKNVALGVLWGTFLTAALLQGR